MMHTSWGMGLMNQTTGSQTFKGTYNKIIRANVLFFFFIHSDRGELNVRKKKRKNNKILLKFV